MNDVKDRIRFNEVYNRVLTISYELASWIPAKKAAQEVKLRRAEIMCKPLERVCEILKDVCDGTQTAEWGTEEVKKIYEETTKELGATSPNIETSSENKLLDRSQRYILYFLGKNNPTHLEKCLHAFNSAKSSQNRICDIRRAVVERVNQLDASRTSKTQEAIIESQRAQQSLDKMKELKEGLKKDKKSCEEYIKQKEERAIGYAMGKQRKNLVDLYVLRRAGHMASTA